MIKGKTDLFALLAKHQAELKRLGVKRWGVFGSFALDQHSPDSDFPTQRESGIPKLSDVQ